MIRSSPTWEQVTWLPTAGVAFEQIPSVNAECTARSTQSALTTLQYRILPIVVAISGFKREAKGSQRLALLRLRN